jgi:hypothetical protein
VGGQNVEIQPRAHVCKILEIADADAVGHSCPKLPDKDELKRIALAHDFSSAE